MLVALISDLYWIHEGFSLGVLDGEADSKAFAETLLGMSNEIVVYIPFFYIFLPVLE